MHRIPLRGNAFCFLADNEGEVICNLQGSVPKMVQVLIVGAGYGGVMAARRLERANYPFTLINKHSYHQFITWLHEAAGGRNDINDYKMELREILPRETTTLIKDEVTGIDREARKVVGRRDSYSYDYVILALGSAPEYFGIEGLAQNSLLLRSVDTAQAIREHIEKQFAAYPGDPRDERLCIVIGGAGLTGIELIGELTDWLPKLCARYKIDRDKPRIINLEAAPSILPVLPSTLQQKAREVLEKKGAQLRTGAKIVRVDPGHVHLESGEDIVSETIIWTGGVRAHPALAQAGFTCDPRGRAKVNPYLQSVDDDHVYIIGDCASFQSGNRPLPPTAQLATQMGWVAGGNVAAQIKGQPLAEFVPKILGTLASLGREVGVGSVGSVQTSGIVAGVAKELTKVKYLYQLGGLKMVRRGSKALTRERV